MSIFSSWQLPHGTFCPRLNISNVKPPRISTPFSVNSEIVDLKEIKNERVSWTWNLEKKLIISKKFYVLDFIDLNAM